MQHGYAKLTRGPEHFINLLHAMGLPGDFLLGWATIVVEIIGGLLILLGALVPLATPPMAIVLLVAIVTVHLPNGFSSIKLESFDAAGAHFGEPGYETDLLYLAGLIALCFGGAGPLSIDGLLRRYLLLFRSPHSDGEQDDRNAACARCSLARVGSAANRFAFSVRDANRTSVVNENKVIEQHQGPYRWRKSATPDAATEAGFAIDGPHGAVGTKANPMIGSHSRGPRRDLRAFTKHRED
jgi:putative oxidoreductase